MRTGTTASRFRCFCRFPKGVPHPGNRAQARPPSRVTERISLHFSQVFGRGDVAHALVATLGLDGVCTHGQGVETSLDTARTSACATSPRGCAIRARALVFQQRKTLVRDAE